MNANIFAFFRAGPGALVSAPGCVVAPPQAAVRAVFRNDDI